MEETCDICGKSIEIDQNFVIEGKYPNISTWRNMVFLQVTNIINRFKKMANGKIYHRECFVKKINEESSK